VKGEEQLFSSTRHSPPSTFYERLPMLRSFGILLFFILATVVGCGQSDKPKYANVKGKVTFNGKPIEKGQITFVVQGQAPSSMLISDGSYSGQAMIGVNNVSVSAMKHSATAAPVPKGAQVQIRGYMEKKKGEPGGPTGDYDPTLVESIPPEWGAHSKETRVVEAGAANEFNIDIKGK
jgi:hypothetical protein